MSAMNRQVGSWHLSLTQKLFGMFALSVGAATLGCSDETKPTTWRPALPPSGSVQGESQVEFAASPILQRLANAGAVITPNAASKWNGRGTRVEFTHLQLSAIEMADVRQIRGNVFLRISSCRVAPGAMKPLNGMKTLTSLEIQNSAIGDRIAAEVSDLPGLQNVSADSSSLSVNGCRFIKTAKLLTHLSLTGLGFSDDIVVLIANSDSLVVLKLDSTAVSDDGLRRIGAMPHLLELSLRNCNISGIGLRDIAELKELRQLTLEGTNITDGSLEALEELPNLNSLDVSRTQITDNGLRPVRAMRELRFLFIQDTCVTDAGVGTVRCLEKLEEIRAERTAATAAVREMLPRVLITLDEHGVASAKAKQ